MTDIPTKHSTETPFETVARFVPELRQRRVSAGVA